VDVDVLDAYYFVPPYLEDMLQRLKEEYEGIVLVPMIPVESAFSCGVACRMVSDVYGNERYSLVRLMNKLWADDELQRIYVDHLFSCLSDSMFQKGASSFGLVLVIHGTLVKDRAGNPPKVFTGLDETSRFFEMMKRKIMADGRNVFSDIRQGCMNHSAGGEWTADTVQKAIEEFRHEGCDGMVMFPTVFLPITARPSTRPVVCLITRDLIWFSMSGASMIPLHLRGGSRARWLMRCAT